MKKIIACLVTIICFFSIPVTQGFNIVKTYAASAETSGDTLECTVTFDCDGGIYKGDEEKVSSFTKTVIAGSLVENFKLHNLLSLFGGRKIIFARLFFFANFYKKLLKNKKWTWKQKMDVKTKNIHGNKNTVGKRLKY